MKISVLIPAYRATFLPQAIASVLTQGHVDCEILINDDSQEDLVREVVERFRDPRIVYSRTAGGEGSAENIRQLWDKAACPLVKYLFDDDILLPHALATLIDLHEAHPTARFVFGHRDIVDANGRIISEPRLVSEGKVVTLSRPGIADALVASCRNRIGELSNVLINRQAGVTLDDIFRYQGHDIAMLVDVALFLNGTAEHPAVGVGKTVGHYRRHGSQNSAFGFNREFYKSLFEWDIFVRGEYAAGHLSAEQTEAAIARLSKGYAGWSGRLPELHILRAGLDELADKVRAGDKNVFGAEFQERWRNADAAARARATAQPAQVG